MAVNRTTASMMNGTIIPKHPSPSATQGVERMGCTKTRVRNKESDIINSITRENSLERAVRSPKRVVTIAVITKRGISEVLRMRRNETTLQKRATRKTEAISFRFPFD